MGPVPGVNSVCCLGPRREDWTRAQVVYTVQQHACSMRTNSPTANLRPTYGASSTRQDSLKLAFWGSRGTTGSFLIEREFFGLDFCHFTHKRPRFAPLLEGGTRVDSPADAGTAVGHLQFGIISSMLMAV